MSNSQLETQRSNSARDSRTTGSTLTYSSRCLTKPESTRTSVICSQATPAPAHWELPQRGAMSLQEGSPPFTILLRDSPLESKRMAVCQATMLWDEANCNSLREANTSSVAA